MLKIRLTRIGKKNSPFFRVVVAEHSKAVKRAFIEILGHYNPISNPKEIVIDKEKSLAWIKKGAQPTPTVNNLMVGLGILPKKEIVKIVHSRPTKKKDAGKDKEAENKAAEKQGSGEAEKIKAEEVPVEAVEENIETPTKEDKIENAESPTEEIPNESAEEEKSEEPVAEATE